MSNRKTTFTKALSSSLPIMAGYVVLGFGFGIILNSKGYGLLWAIAMSVFIYAGSMQYVAIDLISGGVSLITTAVTTLMVNGRHLFYAISRLDFYRKAEYGKPYMVFALTDEVYSLVCTIENDEMPKGVDKHLYCLFLSMICQSYWVTGSALGSIAGSTLPYDFAGVDFAMTALFVAVFVEQWVSSKNHTSAITGIICSLGCLIVFGADSFLIPTMILITAAVTIERKLGLFGEEAANE